MEPEIDLYSLHLLRQVAKFRGFTAAADACGLSQSALTRQVQGIEARLGIRVFERTTRSVTITEPGAVLLRETEAIHNILTGAMRRIREDYLGERREVRIGIARDLALSHIPGIFHAQKKLQPDVRVIVSQPADEDLLRLVENSALDLGILTEPRDFRSTAKITHRMADRFSIIVPAGEGDGASGSRFRQWMDARNWLLPPVRSRSRQLIDEWAEMQKVVLRPVMELESFDLMIQFVSMGMGAAFIPRRGLSAFPRKRLVEMIQPPVDLERQLIVISPAHSRSPEHVTRFVEGILFS
ncbi:MAG: LysR family transcriptional regulator [Verrucomicrobiaceae bacterium]|nr:MAG: LysR family transcriptional regulator [Verrucomicrobiaceae bacterium]